ncbi:MAG: DnaD domain protein [bacterium]|nr:DnaD domain protein [bacterium]
MKSDKLLALLKGNNLVIPSYLFVNYRNLKLNEKQLIFLSYIISSDMVFDAYLFSKDLGWEIAEVMTTISELNEMKLIDLGVKKENGKMKEYIDLSNFYQKILLDALDDEKEEDIPSKVYNIIESEFGRTLSPIENETIAGWLNAGIDESLIKAALKEAVLNGVSNLKYIDKILFEWSKKGYKKESDIKKKKKREKGEELFEYDWLDE